MDLLDHKDLLDLLGRKVTLARLVLRARKDPLDHKAHRDRKVCLEPFRREATSSSWRVIQYLLTTPS